MGKMKGDRLCWDYVSDFRELACCRSRGKDIAGAESLTQACPADSISMHEAGPWLTAEAIEEAKRPSAEAAKKIRAARALYMRDQMRAISARMAGENV